MVRKKEWIQCKKRPQKILLLLIPPHNVMNIIMQYSLDGIALHVEHNSK